MQLILAHGGIPATLEPVIQAPLGYHYGFHLVTALFSAVAGMPPAQSVLWFGQTLNALIALSVYRLASQWWADWKRAALAALLVGLALQMPAYYVVWGRYTLSAGLLVLPLAMAALLRVARGPIRWQDVLTLAVLTCGVALTHLTALLLLGLFTAVMLAGLLGRNLFAHRPLPAGENDPPRPAAYAWGGFAWVAFGTAAGVSLALPWLLRIYHAYGSSVSIDFVSPAAGDQSAYWQYILYLLGPPHNLALLGLAGLGLVWALIRTGSRELAAWGAILALLTLPWGLRLGPFRPDHMAIILFLPAALLLANLVFALVERAGKFRPAGLRWVSRAVLVLAAFGLLGWGAYQTRTMSNRDTIFAQPADLQALDWIRANTRPEATFLINTSVWMGSTYRGVDGGYWISVLTGRSSILPPALYTLGAPDYLQRIGDQAGRAALLTTCDASFWQLVRDTGANYLYVRQGTGSLQPGGLANCSAVVPVYRRDGVYIYALSAGGGAPP